MGRKRTYRNLLKKSSHNVELRYIIVVSLVCMAVAFVLAFFMSMGPSPVDKSIESQISQIPVERMRAIEKEIMQRTGEDNLEDVIKKYREASRNAE